MAAVPLSLWTRRAKGRNGQARPAELFRGAVNTGASAPGASAPEMWFYVEFTRKLLLRSSKARCGGPAPVSAVNRQLRRPSNYRRTARRRARSDAGRTAVSAANHSNRGIAWRRRPTKSRTRRRGRGGSRVGSVEGVIGHVDNFARVLARQCLAVGALRGEQQRVVVGIDDAGERGSAVPAFEAAALEAAAIDMQRSAGGQRQRCAASRAGDEPSSPSPVCSNYGTHARTTPVCLVPAQWSPASGCQSVMIYLCFVIPL